MSETISNNADNIKVQLEGNQIQTQQQIINHSHSAHSASNTHHLLDSNAQQHVTPLIGISPHTLAAIQNSHTHSHFIHATPFQIPVIYNDSMKEENAKKRRRTNYKDTENSARLAAGLNMLINTPDESGQKDLKTVSKLFEIPYNTLRDNYLRHTTGFVNKTKRERKIPKATPDHNVDNHMHHPPSNSFSMPIPWQQMFPNPSASMPGVSDESNQFLNASDHVMSHHQQLQHQQFLQHHQQMHYNMMNHHMQQNYSQHDMKRYTDDDDDHDDDPPIKSRIPSDAK